MNEYIVQVDYFPMVHGKDKLFRIKTDMSKDEVEAKIREKEEKENPYFDKIYVTIETIDEYLSDIELVDINSLNSDLEELKDESDSEKWICENCANRKINSDSKDECIASDGFEFDIEFVVGCENFKPLD